MADSSESFELGTRGQALTESTPPNAATSTSFELRPVTQQRQVLVLLSSFLTIFIVVGFNQSYGVFQGYYSSDKQSMLPPSAKNNGALLAFVGTLGSGLTWGGSIFVNPLLMRVEGKALLGLEGRKWITTTGVLLISLGFGLASLSTEIWHLLLTQGLLYGIGSSMIYFPILSVAPEYFDARRGSAMGFILSGTGVGGLTFSPSFQALLNRFGPRSTLCFLSLLNIVISLPIALSAAPSRFLHRRPTHIDLVTARKATFLFSAGAAFLSAAGILLPGIFLPQFSVVLGYSASFSAILLAILNGVASATQTVIGFAGDKFGRQNTLIFMITLSLLSTLAFWLTSLLSGQRGLWLTFIVFYGIAGGGYNALFPTMVAEVFGMRNYASVNGFMYFVRGLGAMVGSPVGGKMLGNTGEELESWKNVVWFDAALLAGAAICVIVVRLLHAIDRGRWSWKA
jgi:MFS family permease